LQRLVDDLLDLARLDAGHISIEPRPMPADRLLHDVVDNHRPGAYAKNLVIHEQLDPDLPVFGDAQRLRQALDNLLSNAIKYTPEGGSVRVEAQEEANETRLVVVDTGVGIATADLDAVFEVVQEEVETTVLDVAATMRTVRRGISLLEWGRRTLKRGKKKP